MLTTSTTTAPPQQTREHTNTQTHTQKNTDTNTHTADIVAYETMMIHPSGRAAEAFQSLQSTTKSRRDQSIHPADNTCKALAVGATQKPPAITLQAIARAGESFRPFNHPSAGVCAFVCAWYFNLCDILTVFALTTD